jgi:hypothetical protein
LDLSTAIAKEQVNKNIDQDLDVLRRCEGTSRWEKCKPVALITSFR